MSHATTPQESPYQAEAGNAATLELVAALHDRVAQPLTAASMVLGLGDLEEADRMRAAAAVSAALAELDGLLSAVTDEIESQPAPEIAASLGERRLDTVVRSVVSEALANVRKHADPDQVTIVVKAGDGVVTLECVNDGIRGESDGRRGVGLRLAALEAARVGATLDAGPANDGSWRIRLCVGA